MMFFSGPMDVKSDFDSCKCSGKSGYVYAIEYGPYIKIGSTKNLKARINTLRNQIENYSDWSIGSVFVYGPSKNYRKIEKDLHEKFSDRRVRKSELFDLSRLELSEVFIDDRTEGVVDHDHSDLNKKPLNECEICVSRTCKPNLSFNEILEILQSFSDLPDDVLASLLIGVKFGQMMGRPNTESSAK